MLNNLEKKQMKIFFISLVITTFIMGFSMKYAYMSAKGKGLENLVLTQMLMPALSAVLAENLSENRDRIMYRFNIMYILFTAVSYIMAMASVMKVFGDKSYAVNIGAVAVMFVLLAVFYFREDRSLREERGYAFKNRKKSWLSVGLFGLLYIANIAAAGILYYISCLITGSEMPSSEGASSAGAFLIALVLLIPMFFINAPYFYGEEFGWRHFLQPKMQKIFGKRKGVFILGFIWGLWHIFISLYYYSPETFMPQIFSQIAFTMALAVFMGYAYMKTDNIWVPIIIHYMNNNFAAILTGGQLGNRVLSWQQVIVGALGSFIVYGAFIFSKEYREKREEISED